MDDNAILTTPRKAGIYFARSNHCKWYDLIVDVQGEEPMLYISYAFNMNLVKAGPSVVYLRPFDIDCWGPEIKAPGQED